MNKPYAVFVVALFGGMVAAASRPREVGKIGLPGGVVEDGEEPYIAAYRECLEEGWDIEIDNFSPIHTGVVDGKEVWWFLGKNPKRLSEFKERGRLETIVVSVADIIGSGYGNEWIRELVS